MDFGKLPDISNVDFTLPPDHPATLQLLSNLAKSEPENPQVYVGCAKWGRKEWVGKIYPLKTKDSEFLDQYVKQFNCIELNATYYKIPDKQTVKRWKSKAENGFKFCPKFPEGITHRKRLRNCNEEVKQFYDAIIHFEENLGPVFLLPHPQLAPKDFTVLKDFLRSLPSDIPIALELRHADWFKASREVDHAFEYFTKQGIISIITDTSGRRDVLHQRLTTPTAFIRFVGNNLHPTDYTRTDEWVQRLKVWLNLGLKELYFFMHQHEEKDSPELCAYVINQMNDHFGTNLSEVKFVKPQAGLF